VQLSLPFRRKPAADELVSTAVEEVEQQALEPRQRAYTPSKRELGQSTPKRAVGGRRPEPPPKDRKEAARRMREKQREARAEARAGMLAGKEEFLPPRDKGPERSLVRDIVDSRRNAASWFLPGALIVIVGSSGAWPASIRLAANLLWVLLAIAVVIDSIFLSRRIKKILLQRFPKAARPPRSHYFYAIMRAFQMRRLRLPAPKVKVGDPIDA
jgi:hypothetical protein